MNMHNVDPLSLAFTPRLRAFLIILLHMATGCRSSSLDSFIYVGCSQLKYNPGTPYESNVNSILTSILNSASYASYNNFKISLPGSSSSDVVYGLFQCRGDLATSDCHQCVSAAVARLGSTCVGASGGALQLEGCFVRYDNTSFVGAQDKTVVSDKCGPLMSGDSDVLTRRDAVLSYLDAGGQYFRVSGSGKVQGVAQCVQDLSVSESWNKLGNANWGDIGALQLLYATFQSITQYAGVPKNTIEDLAADHSSRLQARRIERQLEDTRVNINGLFRFQHRTASPEIVEVQEAFVKVDSAKSLKLGKGSVLIVEDSNWQKGYRIDEVLNDGETLYYIASPVEDSGKARFLYVGSHPSQLEPAWEDMKLWYQVQRQTKVLGVMKQKGMSSKYIPELIASGRVVHPGQCRKTTTGGHCDQPWCGTPVLVTSPVGRSVADMVRAGQFGADEVIKCCHDCLSALSTSASSGIRHGDIRPENIICVNPGLGQPYFVLIGWGHAILEERDRPALNLHYSSTSALQEGKLCSASDAESLVYMLYFCSGGDSPVLDSVEGAIQWRETSWSRRLIQQKLGDICAVLKAFADYVDSLCGTPYPVDYEIWLRRLKRQINEEGSGKECESSS